MRLCLFDGSNRTDLLPLVYTRPVAQLFIGGMTLASRWERLLEHEFIQKLKDILGVPVLRHSGFLGKDIALVALLGGSGSFAIDAAKHQNADVFITADLKYHDFFKGEKKVLLIDAGHYESEQFTKKIIMEFLSKNFPNFAFISSKTDTNPVHYF